MSKHVVVTVNMAWNIANFRLGLIRSLIGAGYKVTALAPQDEHVARIKEAGCDFVHIPMNNKGTNPLQDLALLLKYVRVLRRLRPDVVLGFTIKPNVYGGMAAGILGIPVVNNIAGLGTTFIREGWLNKVARVLYKASLAKSRKVYFQNADDMALFQQLGLANVRQSGLLPGSGVDTSRFAPQEAAARVNRPFVFLLVARLLWDKGVGEFVEALRHLRSAGYSVEGRLLGFLDAQNPTAIGRADIDAWVEEGLVRYLGSASDVRPYIADADCVVLPSYREGTPRALLEAGSMGKPLITTDAPGCKDVVLDGVTGFKVPVANSLALSEAMKRMANLSDEEYQAMSRDVRAFVVENYDESLVLKAYQKTLHEIFADVR